VPLIPSSGDAPFLASRHDPLVPGVTFSVLRGDVIKQQTYAQATSHRSVQPTREVWIRTGSGEDQRLVLDADAAPALEGHAMSAVVATTADGTVHPMYVRNETTGQTARMERAVFRVAGDDESLGCTVPIIAAIGALPIYAVFWWFARDVAEPVKYVLMMLVALSRWFVLAITRPARLRRIAAVREQVEVLVRSL